MSQTFGTDRRYFAARVDGLTPGVDGWKDVPGFEELGVRVAGNCNKKLPKKLCLQKAGMFEIVVLVVFCCVVQIQEELIWNLSLPGRSVSSSYFLSTKDPIMVLCAASL